MLHHSALSPAAPPLLEFHWNQEIGDFSGTPAILVVDPNEINRRLLRGMLKAAPYRIVEASRADEALEILGAEKVDLVVLDLILPDMSGADFCQRMKSRRETQLTPALILTSVQGVENEIAGIASGADEFLIKPLHPAVVRARIRAMLRNKAVVDSLEEAESILFALAQTVEQRDRYTGGHCQRLATASVALGLMLGLTRPELVALHRGGYLHDIGKVAVPDAILFKRDSLSPEEWVVMRSHPARGEEICRPMKSLAPVLPIIRSHHERWDGSGYPDGLRGEQIPLVARILQIVDIYDALTTPRAYKPALSHEAAFQHVEEEVQRGWRDPEIVALFREMASSAKSSGASAEPEAADDAELMRQSLAAMDRELSL